VNDSEKTSTSSSASLASLQSGDNLVLQLDDKDIQDVMGDSQKSGQMSRLEKAKAARQQTEDEEKEYMERLERAKAERLKKREERDKFRTTQENLKTADQPVTTNNTAATEVKVNNNKAPPVEQKTAVQSEKVQPEQKTAVQSEQAQPEQKSKLSGSKSATKKRPPKKKSAPKKEAEEDVDFEDDEEIARLEAEIKQAEREAAELAKKEAQLKKARRASSGMTRRQDNVNVKPESKDDQGLGNNKKEERREENKSMVLPGRKGSDTTSDRPAGNKQRGPSEIQSMIARNEKDASKSGKKKKAFLPFKGSK